MKNDVVRWQPTATTTTTPTAAATATSNGNICKSSNNKQQKSQRNLWQHVAKTNCQQQHNEMSTYVATRPSSDWQQQEHQQHQQQEQQQQQQQQTIIKCDIRKNFNFNCNLFKTSFLTQSSSHSSSGNRSRSSNSRHLKITPATTIITTRTRTPTAAVLLLILQFSAVVFLCNFNVGFVAGSVSSPAASSFKLEVGQSQSSSSSSSSSSPVLPPYVLDYETGSGNAKLTPSNTRNGNTAGHYTHTWAVHIPNGDNGIADAVAKDHGFVNLGKIFDDHYHFAHHKVSKRSLSPATHHQTRLDFDERVHWAQQQKAKSRSKRDFIRMRPSRTSSRTLVDVMGFDDAKWPQMWYLNRGPGLDMNVIRAWKQGITGKGVVVTILDDGLESDHPDIEQNYDPKASYDVNSHDDDPMPHYDMTDSNRHGTRCAGEVAATANNSFCAVGIAYEASVGGVRMLDGDVTDAVEARSLSLNPQHIDIYSASWGPDDDGKTVDGPGELASRAFIEGTTKGRGGKGSIFIWASGNGGREQDNCNCDGYTNSIWTLSISSATEEGHVPWYSEKCSSTLATTYSSGGQSEKQVVTTDLHHSCTVSHTGTSASAPLAAGIAALVLQSNQNLTWRDLQHIVVRTAHPGNLKDSNWARNGVGRRVSHSFGYGLMDAAEMVQVARTWKTVPEQQRCEINAPHVDKVIPPRTHITLQLSVNHCRSVNYLEHVQAKITLTSQRRGDIQLYLKSPANTKVTLLTPRIHDNSRSGFNQWPFMSVHTWGESPHGNWQLEIHNEGRYMAQITQWDMIFYGTDTPAQPDDPPNVDKPNQFPYGNDMAHNDIEYDASGQWRNMQQVGEVGMTRDRSNTAACLKWSDHKCLECKKPAYFYEGLCFDQCPQHSYPYEGEETVEETDEADGDDISSTTSPVPSSSNASLAADHPITVAPVSNSINDKDDPLQAEDRRRRQSDGLVPLVLAQSHICVVCHKSCLDCYGPLATQCSTCYPGSQLRKETTNETVCYAYVIRSTGLGTVVDVSNIDAEASNSNLMHYMNWTTTLLVLAVVMGLVGVVLAGGIAYNRRVAKTSNSSDQLYTRVALMADESDDDNDGDEEIFKTHILGPPNAHLDYRDEVKVPIKLLAEQEVVDNTAAASEDEGDEFTHLVSNQNET